MMRTPFRVVGYFVVAVTALSIVAPAWANPKVDALPTVRIAPLDLNVVRAEDEARSAEGLAPRFAVPHHVVIRPDTDGVWSDKGDVNRLWQLRITSPGALSLNLGFTAFYLPEGAVLRLYAVDGSYDIRPLTAGDNAAHGEFWSPVLLTDDMIVELELPEKQVEQLVLELGSINIGYRGFGENTERAGACNVDVVCPLGQGWEDEINSVAVISTGGSLFCSGFMVNNTAQDQTPFFMTAAHCGVNSGNAASLVVYWNYQTTTCAGPRDGQLVDWQTGSIFRASNSTSDFTLVELVQAPNPTWEVTFAGWDRSSNDPQWSVAIHHPRTDEKSISFDYDPGTTTSYLGTTVPGNGTHIRIGQWEDGTTEPGSSGSPLFNQNHQVIGQLHGGYASCTVIDADWYGRFSVSWDGGGTPATRLSDWLDPLNTGQMTINTLSARGITVTPSNEVLHLGVVGGPFTDDTYAYTLANNTPDPVDYTVHFNYGIGLLMNGGPGPLGGTLASGASFPLTITLGPAIYALPAGLYEEELVVTNVGTGVGRTIKHKVEIGLTAITVTPADGLTTGGPLGGPFNGFMNYTVTSTRPTPVTVNVAGDQGWIAINGSNAPAAFTLTGIGDSANVTVAIDNSATGLSAGLYAGTVTFTNTAGGPGSTTRAVSLDVGRIAYAATDVPQPILDNTTIYSYIDVPDSFCIGDVNVDINITHTFIGDLIVELRSPDGTEVRLHNRTGGSADDIVVTFDDDGDGRQPDGPGALADFDLTQAQGVWRLRVSDLAGADVGTLNSWTLRVAPTTGNCEPPILIYSETLDQNPGWTTEGQWAFGQPTGGGGSSGLPDPTSGYTGPYVYGYNLAGDYVNNMPAYHLTSTPFDCTGLTGVQFRYWRWLNVETTTYDKATVYVSIDGVNWVQVWQNPGRITDNAWTQMSHKISALADNQPTVYLRWTMGPTDSSLIFSGWNIDDIEIWAQPSTPPVQYCPGDMNCDTLVNFADISLFIAALKTADPATWPYDPAGGVCAHANGDMNGDSLVNFADISGFIAMIKNAPEPCTTIVP